MTPTVIFIGGYGRMGSTLLGQILGQTPESFFAGELRHIWDRGLRDNQLCECGSRFRSCPFWREVIQEGFGSMEAASADAPWDIMAQVSRLTSLPRVLASVYLGHNDRAVGLYQELTQRIITAIATVADANVVIDSSKVPNHGFSLVNQEARLHVVHMVRDSRAVAFSWARLTPMPEIPDRETYVRRRSTVESALAWLVAGALTEHLRKRSSGILLRYEDLVSSPSPSLTNLYRCTGLEQAPPLYGEKLHLDPGHSVAGNRSRFRSGEIELRLDDDWATDMPRASRRIVWALTSPLARRLGYDR